MKDQSSVKSVKARKVLRCVLVSMTVLIVLAFVLPLLIGDGTGRFTGIEGEVAKQQLDVSYKQLDTMHRVDIPPVKYYVEDVYPMDPSKAKKYCHLLPGDDGTKYYAVDISIVTFFGFRIDRGTSLDDCIYRRITPVNP